jgi:DNA-binding FadR family transcriptional regulator
MSDAGISEKASGAAPQLSLRAVGSGNAFEETFTQLVQAIHLGTVPLGDKFPPERALSEMLGVSRSTVREVFRGLEQSGYIETRRGRYGGSFVVRDEPLLARETPDTFGERLLETLDFRAAIEPGAAELAAHRVDRSQVAQMRALVEEMKLGTPEYVRGNSRLHILIAEVTDCAPLSQAVTTVELELTDAFIAIHGLDMMEVHSHSQHLEIIDAIEAEDSGAARQLMHDHLAGSHLMMREFVSAKWRR